MGTTSESIPWTHDFNAAMSTAAARQRLVLLDFSAAPM
jgi:hypothetical protein